MLEARGLHAAFGGATVLDGAALHVASGEVVALLGEAGAGKTVLCRALCGLLPSAGRVAVQDSVLPAGDHVAAVRAGLILVPQAGLVFPNLAVRDNLLLGATVRGRMRRQVRLAEVLEVLPRLRPVMGRPAGTLDRAEQQMVALGRGLMATPRCLVLDDPGQALPDTLRTELVPLLDRLARLGTAILLAGRALAPPLTAASRILVLHHGRVLPGAATPDGGHHPC